MHGANLFWGETSGYRPRVLTVLLDVGATKGLGGVDWLWEWFNLHWTWGGELGWVSACVIVSKNVLGGIFTLNSDT